MSLKIIPLRLIKTLTGLVLGACISTAIAVPFTGLTSGDPEMREPYLVVFIMGSIIVSAISVPFGLIVHAVFYALKWRGALPYVLVGGLGGAGYAGLGSPDEQFLHNLLLYSLWAAAAATIAWVIRRPDKDDPKLPPPESHF